MRQCVRHSAEVTAALSHEANASFAPRGRGSHVVPAELERALHKRFGRPLTPRSLQVFGVGIKHAFGYDDLTFKLPDDVLLDPADRLLFEQAVAKQFELEMLRGPAADTPLPWLDTTAHRHVGVNYQKKEQEQGSRAGDGADPHRETHPRARGDDSCRQRREAGLRRGPGDAAVVVPGTPLLYRCLRNALTREGTCDPFSART